MIRLKYKIIAIDYDGTIAPNEYPDVGIPLDGAVRVMKKISEYGGKIIIWTCRTGEQAELVKRRLHDAGVKFDAFNEQLPEILEVFTDNGRKIFADVYIDDRANFCKGIDWDWVEQNLFIGMEE